MHKFATAFRRSWRAALPLVILFGISGWICERFQLVGSESAPTVRGDTSASTTKLVSLFLSDRIDRETLCEFSGTCTLSLDVVLENPFEQHNVDVEILDANDNSPLFPRDEYQLEISEGAQPGARFSIEGAQDSDDASNSVRHYRLTSNEHLALDSTKPPADGKHIELVLKKPFDRELLQSHQFLLTATDGGSPPRSGTAKST